MDRWRKAYADWGFSDLDYRSERFLVYGAAAAFWIQLVIWLLLQEELIDGVDDAKGWLTLTLLAIPGNVRVAFLIALGPTYRNEWTTTWRSPQANPRNEWTTTWRSPQTNPRNEWTTTWRSPQANPRNRGRDHRRARPGKNSGRPRSPAKTLVPILVGLTLFAVCAGYGITGGTIVEPSDSATSPPRLRNQVEKRYMLELINEARTQAGVPPVVMGTYNVAQIQAEQLLEDCVASHWGTDGLKPYMRYSLGGGYQVNGENVSTYNECDLWETWLQWNEKPTEMVRQAVEDWLDSPGHRRTMLDPSYRKVNIGLAWDRNTFKAIQHFEADHVKYTRLPTIKESRLELEGRLKDNLQFTGKAPLLVLLMHDQKPERLTKGQLARTYCYEHGETIAVLVPPLRTLKDEFEVTKTSEKRQCVDPYTVGREVEEPESRDDMLKLWEESRENSKTTRETELTLRFRKAGEMTAKGSDFSLNADVSELLEEHGPGVYTIVLLAELENAPKNEHQIISEYSIFHKVTPPSTYRQKTVELHYPAPG